MDHRRPRSPPSHRVITIVHDPIISAAELNHDLQLISDWAYQWKMAFNPDPSKQAVELVFSQKKKKQIHLQ